MISWVENDSHALNTLYDRKNTTWRKLNTEFRIGLCNLMLNKEEKVNKQFKNKKMSTKIIQEEWKISYRKNSM